MQTMTLLSVPGTFGALAPSLIDEIKAHGFDGVRVDVHPGGMTAHHNLRRAQIDSFKAYPSFFVIFLIGPHQIDLTRQQLVDKTRDFSGKLLNAGYAARGNFALEIGNEPDLAIARWKRDAGEMGRAFYESYCAAREVMKGATVLSPSISNLNGRGLGYLEAMASYLPENCGVAIHRYPNGRDFDIPHAGFTSRHREIDAVRAIAGDRSIWNTETGWAERNKRYTLTEAEVAERVERERAFNARHRLASYTAYQINSDTVRKGDDDDTKRMKTYGFRRPDGTWKPSAERIKMLASSSSPRTV